MQLGAAPLRTRDPDPPSQPPSITAGRARPFGDSPAIPQTEAGRAAGHQEAVAPCRPQTPPWDGMGTRQRPRLTPLGCGWLQPPAGFYTGRAQRFVPPGRGVGFPVAARRTDTARQPTFSRLPVSSLPSWAAAQTQRSAQTPCPHRAVGAQDGTLGSHSTFTPRGLGLKHHLDHSRGAGHVPSPKCIPFSALPRRGWGCTGDGNFVPIAVPTAVPIVPRCRSSSRLRSQGWAHPAPSESCDSATR